MTKYNEVIKFSGMDYVELERHIVEAIGELKRKSYAKGYEQGRIDGEPEAPRMYSKQAHDSREE